MHGRHARVLSALGVVALHGAAGLLYACAAPPPTAQPSATAPSEPSPTVPLPSEPSPSERSPSAVAPSEPLPSEPRAEEPNEPPLDAQPVGSAPSGVPGATVTLGSLTADGLSARDMSCRFDGNAGVGGLFGAFTGPAVVIGSLAKKKAELDRCAPQGAEVRVRWSFAGGRVSRAEAVDTKPPLKACVEAVVKSAVCPMDGECAATLRIGKS